MVARAVISECASVGDDAVALTRQELDIADRDAVHAAIEDHRPDAVINCAAYTDVDGAESAADASRAANTIGVENLAVSCRRYSSRLITISTDYVFDGAKFGFYTEDDPPNPRGVYAVTKYEGEIAAGRSNPDVVIVRSGWIYGEGGTNFLSVMHRLLAEGKRIKAIEDAYGTPTYAANLARRLRELAARQETGLFHVTNAGDGTSYLGFAEEICQLGGFDRELVEVVSNADLRRPAPRPVSSKLASVRLPEMGVEPLPDWKDALATFVSSST